MRGYYVIGNLQYNDLWWSNEFGWVEWDSVDIFSSQEMVDLRLPLDGIWEYVTIEGVDDGTN